MRLSDILRAEALEIGRDWLAAMKASHNEALALEPPTIIDHLPELLVGLADWVDGDRAGAQRSFDALAAGHALQRLGHGIALRSLVSEYALLRSVMLRKLLSLPISEELQLDLVRLNEGMDHAVSEAIVRYSTAREATRETFLGILGHDLRNPLSAISLAAQRLAELPLGPESKHAALILRASRRMQRMITDLLDFARARLGGGFPINPVDDDMGEMCRVAIEELRLVGAGRRIEVVTEGNLSGRWDHDRVVQALSNLLANAIEHGADPIRVEARAEGEVAVVTRLSNQGAVIPEPVLRTLFDPFGDRSSSSSGLGLGLYIVREIVLAHGATIDVSSEAGSGTTFTIRWPRALQYP